MREMRRLHDSLDARHENRFSELRQLHNGLADRHEKHDAGIEDMRKLHSLLEESHRSGVAAHHRLQGDCEDRWRRLSGATQERHVDDVAMMTVRQEVADLVGIVQDQDKRSSTWRAEITAEVAEEIRVIKAGRLVDVEEFRLELRELFRELEGRMLQGSGQHQERQISELRSETSTAFRSEAAAVAALDEQLWLTDQRLGQRIDEIVHSHRESMAVVERRIGNMQSNRYQLPGRERTEVTEASRGSSPARIEIHNHLDAAAAKESESAYRPSPQGSKPSTYTPGGRSLRATKEAEDAESPGARGARGEEDSHSSMRNGGALRALGSRRLRGIGDDDVEDSRVEEEPPSFAAFGGRRLLLRGNLR